MAQSYSQSSNAYSCALLGINGNSAYIVRNESAAIWLSLIGMEPSWPIMYVDVADHETIG